MRCGRKRAYKNDKMNKYIIPATLIGTGMVFIFVYIERRKEVKKVKPLKTTGAVNGLKKMEDAAKKVATAFPEIPEINQDWIYPQVKPANNPPIMIAEPKTRMKDSERRELIERVKAMSREELELVAEIIPVDLCLKRIDSELQKAKEFEKSIKSAMNGLVE